MQRNNNAKKIVPFNNQKNEKSETKLEYTSYTIRDHFLVDHNRLQNELIGYWKSDVWKLRDNPTGIFPKRGKNFYKLIRFECENKRINLELKYITFTKFINRNWSPKSITITQKLHRFIKFLNAEKPKVNSLLDYSFEKWEIIYRTFLADNNQWFIKKYKKLDGNQEKREVTQKDLGISFLRVLYRTIENEFDTREEHEKDIWDGHKITTTSNPAVNDRWLNFTRIKIKWLREATKKYIYRYIATHSLVTCVMVITGIAKFSGFLEDKFPNIEPQNLSRELMLDYINWLASPESKLAVNQQQTYTTMLRFFLENVAREGYVPIPEKPLIYQEDIPRRTKRKPRFIPEFVMAQLETVIGQSTDPQFIAMTQLLIETGVRSSELCRMELNCLSQDANGDYFLLYYQGKTFKEHTIPITKNLAKVIIEQERRVLNSDTETKYLFPNKRGNAYKTQRYRNQLNELGYEAKIKDENGKLWRFQPHQLRHTIGTRMINNNVPQHIVQQFLGHESPEMTAVYAHIHDSTLKREFEKYIQTRGDLIDVTGSVIKREQPTEADNIDLQWFKKNIQAQALPNGYCGLPAVQTACPHANACLSCASFRTDSSFLPQHKKQLQETQKLVQISRTNGWERQAEMNEKVAKNLTTMIEKLEVNPKETDEDKKFGGN